MLNNLSFFKTRSIELNVTPENVHVVSENIHTSPRKGFF